MLKRDIIAKVKYGFFPETFIENIILTEKSVVRAERIITYRTDCDA